MYKKVSFSGGFFILFILCNRILFLNFAIHLIFKSMNYKELFNRVAMLISSPAKAWDEIACEEDKKKLLGAFVYPMIGFCGLSVFIGTFIGNTAGSAAFHIAMTRCCAIFVSLFGGFFLASYLVDLLGQKWLGRAENQGLNQQFVGYSMVVIFVLNIISGLFSISILHWILQFYTVFVVYEGARLLLDVEEKQLTRFALVASLVIVASPELIAMIFNKLSLILN